MSDYDNPLKWLLAALPGYIEPEALAVLMQRYDANKHAYERQIKIRHAERVIRRMELSNYPDEAARLARWKAKLANLKAEAGV